MFAVRGQAFLHHYRRLRITKLSITELRQYSSREWNKWKHSEERRLFLRRNERMWVDVRIEHCHVLNNNTRAVLTTGATLLIGFVAIQGTKSKSHFHPPVIDFLFL